MKNFHDNIDSPVSIPVNSLKIHYWEKWLFMEEFIERLHTAMYFKVSTIRQ
jgi:hypothetical protein